MKKLVWIIIAFQLIGVTNRLLAQEVDAYFYYSPFFAPGKGTYVETYLAFAGNSMRYIVNNDHVFQATAEVTMLFKNADKIVEFRKFKVVSPGMPDTSYSFQVLLTNKGLLFLKVSIISN